MEEEERQQSLPLNVDVIQATSNGNFEDEPEQVEYWEFEAAVSVWNGPLQASVLCCLLILSVAANASVIINIRRNTLKVRSNHFLLIQHLCLVDLMGASLVLPTPLATSLAGKWMGGSKFCHVSSAANVALWLQHVFMFFMLKIDRVLATVLPIGRYPIFPPRVNQWLVAASWLLALALGTGVTSATGARFEPSLLLCVPKLPTEFGITIVSLYCSAFAAMVVGYVVLIFYSWRERHSPGNATEKKTDEPASNDSTKQELTEDSPSTVPVLNNRAESSSRSAASSLLVTASHLLLYLPALLLLGLQGAVVNPVAAALCALIVYAEFLVHPIVLLSTSQRMRQEILHSVYRRCKS